MRTFSFRSFPDFRKRKRVKRPVATWRHSYQHQQGTPRHPSDRGLRPACASPPHPHMMSSLVLNHIVFTPQTRARCSLASRRTTEKPMGAFRDKKRTPRGVVRVNASPEDSNPRPPSLTKELQKEDPELDALEQSVLDADIKAKEARERLARLVEQREKENSPTQSLDDSSADAVLNASPFARVRCEYGYIQSNTGVYIDASKTRPPTAPNNVLKISSQNFTRELQEMIKYFKKTEALDDQILASLDDGASAITESDIEAMSALRDELETLTLSNDAIWERERNRTQVDAPWVIKGPYLVLCGLLDALFPENKPVQRFWFLESVARMPYFSYNAMLTLYELLGWWRRGSELQRVHFAEQWNEYQHLLVMESLGGDRSWRDRFLAQHAALAYFFLLCFTWLASPTLAYNFSELIEAHAVDTYGQFADENKEILRKLPAPRVAKAYWGSDDLYLFDAFQSARPLDKIRRPKVKSLYDVFVAIRDDEQEHVATMGECQEEDTAGVDVGKVDLISALTVASITVTFWVTNFVTKTGGEVFIETEVDMGEMLGEDGVFAGLARLLSMLPFF